MHRLAHDQVGRQLPRHTDSDSATHTIMTALHLCLPSTSHSLQSPHRRCYRLRPHLQQLGKHKSHCHEHAGNSGFSGNSAGSPDSPQRHPSLSPSSKLTATVVPSSQRSSGVGGGLILTLQHNDHYPLHGAHLVLRQALVLPRIGHLQVAWEREQVLRGEGWQLGLGGHREGARAETQLNTKHRCISPAGSLARHHTEIQRDPSPALFWDWPR